MNEQPEWKLWVCEEKQKVRYLQEIFLEVAKSCQMQLYSGVSA